MHASLKFAFLTSVTSLLIGSALYADEPAAAPITDSSDITPSSVNPMYPEVQTPTTPLANMDYSAVPVCSIANSSNCKDIDGLPVKGTNCAKVCRVNQIVVGDPLKPTSVTPAVCPKEYAVINSFNEGPEYVQQSYSYLSYIDNTTDWYTYQSAGYTCGNMSQEYCHGSSCTGWGYWAGNPQPKGLMNVLMCNGTPAVVNMTDRYCDSTFTTDCKTGFHEWDTCGYYQQCVRQAGLFQSGKTIPNSVVCSLEVAKWLQAPATKP